VSIIENLVLCWHELAVILPDERADLEAAVGAQLLGPELTNADEDSCHLDHLAEDFLCDDRVENENVECRPPSRTDLREPPHDALPGAANAIGIHVDVDRLNHIGVNAKSRFAGKHDASLEFLRPRRVALPLDLPLGILGSGSNALVHAVGGDDDRCAVRAEIQLSAPGALVVSIMRLSFKHR
jgi:hypothetical protein